MLDMAAFIPRHNYIQWCSSTPAKVTLRPMVKCRGPGIQPNLCSENQLCVPTMTTRGDSFRSQRGTKAAAVGGAKKEAHADNDGAR